MKRRIITVTPAKGGWDVKTGQNPHGPRYSVKSKAVVFARALARRMMPSQLRIKGRNGRIQTEHTYGADPRRYVG